MAHDFLTRTSATTAVSLLGSKTRTAATHLRRLPDQDISDGGLSPGIQRIKPTRPGGRGGTRLLDHNGIGDSGLRSRIQIVHISCLS